mgnify:CR=1 FL=1
MIDEKIVIKDIENRIDTFVKQYPKEKDCRSVQVQREFIHILELAAKKQKAKEHERMLSIESELLGTLNDASAIFKACLFVTFPLALTFILPPHPFISLPSPDKYFTSL